MRQTIAEELDTLRASGLFRTTRLLAGSQGRQVSVDGRECLLFCSNNYLGLANHPVLAEAACRAAGSFGTSSGASRLVSGTMSLHEELETAIARFKGTEAALLFNSGYAANTGIIQALAGRGDTVFSDRLNHASIIDGIMLSGARLVRYRHNDADDLCRLLERYDGRGRALIVTDGVFSMDGDMAPLRRLVELKQACGALLIVDDAHGSGVLGETGKGTAEHQGVTGGIDVQMGTFGKALGSFGAYAALSGEMRDLLVNRARSFIFSTSLPPAVLAASLAALELIRSPEGAVRRDRLRRNIILFREALAEQGIVVPVGETPIVPIMAGEADLTMALSGMLLKEGVFVQGIRPPTVPAGSCRLRFTLMSSHTDDDLKYAAVATARAFDAAGAA